MSFNKTQYWENRAARKRGQGEYTVPKANAGEVKDGSNYMQVGAQLVAVNRAAARRKVVDRRLTSKTARIKSNEETRAIAERVKRTEAGERARIESLKQAA